MSTVNAQIGVTSAHIGSQSVAWSNSNVGVMAKESYPYTLGSAYNNMIVFRGLVEVEKAANGFVVRIGQRQGEVATTYVAKDVAEVNGIITAEMVKFKLEEK